MFTAENSSFTDTERQILNAAAARLMNDRVDEDASDEAVAQIEKSIADAVNNAWVEGITVGEIVAKVRGGHV